MMRHRRFESVQFERHSNQVLEVILDRQGDDLNRVDAAFHRELALLFGDLRYERDGRAILLTARGKAFSAGGDFAWFPELRDRATLEALLLDARRMIYDLIDLHLPIVCAINGPAVGLGASLALLCDVIFIAESASLRDPHVLVGLAAGDGGTIAWPLAIGPARAKQYLLTGDSISAAEAERVGLVNFVVIDDDVRTRALAFAGRLAALPPLALRHTKASINSGIRIQVLSFFDQTAAYEIATFASADHREALASMLERRAPGYTGT